MALFTVDAQCVSTGRCAGASLNCAGAESPKLFYLTKKFFKDGDVLFVVQGHCVYNSDGYFKITKENPEAQTSDFLPFSSDTIVDKIFICPHCKTENVIKAKLWFPGNTEHHQHICNKCYEINNICYNSTDGTIQLSPKVQGLKVYKHDFSVYISTIKIKKKPDAKSVQMYIYSQKEMLEAVKELTDEYPLDKVNDAIQDVMSRFIKVESLKPILTTLKSTKFIPDLVN